MDPYLEGKRIIDCRYLAIDKIQCPIKEDILKMETCRFCGHILQYILSSEGKKYCPNPKCKNEINKEDIISYKEFFNSLKEEERVKW